MDYLSGQYPLRIVVRDANKVDKFKAKGILIIILFYFILSYLILSYLILYYIILYYIILYYIILYYIILYYIILYYIILYINYICIAEVRVGDLKDTEFMKEAFAHVHTVISLVGTNVSPVVCPLLLDYTLP